MCLPGPIKCPSCDAGCWYVQEDLPWLHIHNSERINWKRKHHFYGDWIIFSWTHWLRALQGDRHQIWYCATAQKQESWQMQNHNHVQKPNGDGIFGHKHMAEFSTKQNVPALKRHSVWECVKLICFLQDMRSLQTTVAICFPLAI